VTLNVRDDDVKLEIDLCSSSSYCVSYHLFHFSSPLTAMVQILPPRSSVLIKKELLYAGLFGVTSWLCGLVFVDRSNRSKAHETMEKTARIMHERNVRK